MSKSTRYIVWAALMILGYVFYSLNYYVKDELITVEVLEQMTSVGRYGSTKPILILQESKTGVIFDMFPSASLAYQMPKGTVRTLSLPRSYWNQSQMENIFLLFMYIVFECLVFVICPVVLVIVYFEEQYLNVN